jgi:hypothetical protein
MIVMAHGLTGCAAACELAVHMQRPSDPVNVSGIGSSISVCVWPYYSVVIIICIPRPDSSIRHTLYAAVECAPQNVPICGGISPAIDQKACIMHKWGENKRP